MGHGIGRNILLNGYPLTVIVHRNRKPVEDLITDGAREAKTPRDIAAASDVVLLCVTGSPEVEATIYGENGLLGAVRKASSSPTARPRCRNRRSRSPRMWPPKAAHYVDTPLTRTPKEAEAGKLGLMTGGDKAVLEDPPGARMLRRYDRPCGSRRGRAHAEARQQLHRSLATRWWRPRRSLPRSAPAST